jgi:xanthine dehydrogenase accessory factor
MSPSDILNTAQRLQQQGQPFALVTVLRVQAPASARPGDKAVVTAQGFSEGWIGGGCAQPAVLRTVRQALTDGRARMIRIAPVAEGSDGADPRELDEVLEFGMACHSGGTLELFVDPVLPQARLVVIGDSPVAVALAGLAPRLGLAVTVIAEGQEAGLRGRFADAQHVLASDDPTAAAQAVAAGALVVVATQGRRDVQGLRAALALHAHTVWMVASARKAQVLKASLVAAGHDATAVAAIVAPAGQAVAEQMGAHTPEEIALSVLAAVVAVRRHGHWAPVAVSAPAGAASAVDLARMADMADMVPSGRPDLPAKPAETTPTAASCCGGGAAGRPKPEPKAEAEPAPAAAAAVAVAAATRSNCCGG